MGKIIDIDGHVWERRQDGGWTKKTSPVSAFTNTVDIGGLMLDEIVREEARLTIGKTANVGASICFIAVAEWWHLACNGRIKEYVYSKNRFHLLQDSKSRNKPLREIKKCVKCGEVEHVLYGVEVLNEDTL